MLGNNRFFNAVNSASTQAILAPLYTTYGIGTPTLPYYPDRTGYE